MIRLGGIELGEVPRIAVVFTGGNAREVLDTARGFDIVELRIDLFPSLAERHVLERMAAFKDSATIGTIRSKAEGGKWDLPEAQRLDLFKAIAGEAGAVDIELSSREIVDDVIAIAHAQGKLAIASYHNFERTPPYADLESVVREAKAKGADIVKIATHCSAPSDLKALARLTVLNHESNLIVIGMGAAGAASRVFFPALGSLMTYACTGAPVAPGQYAMADMVRYMETFFPRAGRA